MNLPKEILKLEKSQFEDPNSWSRYTKVYWANGKVSQIDHGEFGIMADVYVTFGDFETAYDETCEILVHDGLDECPPKSIWDDFEALKQWCDEHPYAGNVPNHPSYQELKTFFKEYLKEDYEELRQSITPLLARHVWGSIVDPVDKDGDD